MPASDQLPADRVAKFLIEHLNDKTVNIDGDYYLMLASQHATSDQKIHFQLLSWERESGPDSDDYTFTVHKTREGETP